MAEAAQPRADLLVRNAAEVVTLAGASEAPLRGAAMREVKAVAGGAVAVAGREIVAVGPTAEVEAAVQVDPNTKIIDARGGTVVPGLVDPHTHLLFTATRVDEFYQRVAGVPYLEIARQGGGIGRTTGEMRKASHDELMAAGRFQLDLMLRQGTTTVEIKTGYGLSTESELRHLEVIAALASERNGGIVATFLGAHALPPDYRERRGAYLDLVIDEMLPEVAARELATYCDVFCETGAFTVEESRRVLEAAASRGLDTKVHADELAHSGGTALAAELDACSVDHLNFASAEDLERLARGRTIAVLLPATPCFLLAPRYADGRAVIDAGVPVALATDYNPTSSISSMLFVMFLACLHMKLHPSEALAAATINAAHAIGQAGRVGSLEPGKQADLLVLDVPSHRDIAFYVGRDIVDTVLRGGRVVAEKC